MIYNIYTDGSVKRNGNNGSIGGYAFIVTDGYGCLVDAYAKTGIENTTNNRMELTAILAALFMYQKRMRTSKDEGAHINLYSDSAYALNALFQWSISWANNDWKTASGQKVKNQDLIKNFYDKQWGVYQKNIQLNKRDSWRNFIYNYVKGHEGNPGNELADKLATGELTPDKLVKGQPIISPSNHMELIF